MERLADLVDTCAGHPCRAYHRRAAFESRSASLASAQFERGIRETLEHAGGMLPDPFVFYHNILEGSSGANEREQEGKLERLCLQPNRPTVMFTAFDPLAEMIYLLLRRFRLSIPEDISLVGFGGVKREGAVVRRLSSVIVDQAATAAKAVALLDEMKSGTRPINSGDETFDLPFSMGRGRHLG